MTEPDSDRGRSIDSVVRQYVGNKSPTEEIINETDTTWEQIEVTVQRLSQSEFRKKQTPHTLRVTT